jgi:hypothetical protein
LFTAAQESVEERVKAQIDAINAHNADNTTKSQIEAIGKNDPWVYTPEGMATLTNVLDSQPYLWNAPDPYKAAYLLHKGQQNVSVSRSAPQVLTTTPTARPSAPVPTGQAARQTVVPTVDFNKMSKADLDKHLSTLTKEQQSAFFQKAIGRGF